MDFNMMQHIRQINHAWKRCFVRLKRIGSGKGFGIQSPSAFRFVTGVVNAHHPADSYPFLRDCDKAMSSRQRNLFLLYARMAKDREAAEVWNIGAPSDTFRHYMAAACDSALYRQIEVKARMVFPVDGTLLIRLSHACIDQQLCRQLVETAPTRTILVLEDIYLTPQALQCWQWITQQPQTGDSFDLFDCGIIFFQKNLCKNHYRVNIKNKTYHENQQSLYEDRR